MFLWDWWIFKNFIIDLVITNDEVIDPVSKSDTTSITFSDKKQHIK